MFAVEKCGVGWLCSGVCGCDEVHTVSVSVKLETVFMWDKDTEWIVAVHEVGE